MLTCEGRHLYGRHLQNLATHTKEKKNTVNCSFDSEVKCPFNFSVNYCNRRDKVSAVAVTKVNIEEEQEKLPTDKAATVHWLLWFK